MENYLVKERRPISHFTIIPNVVIREMGLTPHIGWLYIYFKSVAGESGVCFQSTETLSRNTNMSVGTISKCKNRLRDLGLIEIKTYGGHGFSDEIIINDVWDLNAETYQSGSPGEAPGSPHEAPGSPGEPKNNPLRKSLKNINNNGFDKKEVANQIAMALGIVCKMDYKIVSVKNRLFKSAWQLYYAGYKQNDVYDFQRWWKKNDWRGVKGQTPTPEQVLAEINKAKILEKPIVKKLDLSQVDKIKIEEEA